MVLSLKLLRPLEIEGNVDQVKDLNKSEVSCPDSRGSMVISVINPGAVRKKMGTGEGNNSSTEETKVVMDELAKTLSEGSWVVDSVAADMEGLEGAISVGPIIQIDCGVGQAQKVKLGLVSSISNEYILTPKKPNTRKWKRTARKGSGQSALEVKMKDFEWFCLFLKLNSDVSIRQSCDLVGLGGVIKNSDGWIVAAFAKPLKCCVSVEVGEFLGLK
ncbi:hypothetical protein JRO89_XS13G0235000 [Xanthoceras sorbifolium]|uniref:Uncharacterized protein n=1 Tax=Xanthoceras sorbifolium TaxID=99658 RepID=A0ABQ8H9P2_9ROSI|nr:hypothetical protein JRO89_XS13G0235000 [Xanthoceras sorbifolium]